MMLMCTHAAGQSASVGRLVQGLNTPFEPSGRYSTCWLDSSDLQCHSITKCKRHCMWTLYDLPNKGYYTPDYPNNCFYFDFNDYNAVNAVKPKMWFYVQNILWNSAVVFSLLNIWKKGKNDQKYLCLNKMFSWNSRLFIQIICKKLTHGHAHKSRHTL